MERNASAFCSALECAVAGTSARPFRYVEVGVAKCQTMAAVYSMLKQIGVEFLMQGVDQPGWSWDGTWNPQDGRITFHAIGSQEFWRQQREPVGFVFIDACHGAPCVTADFLAAEPHVDIGGVVAFHDTDEWCQGQHPQPHCGTGIEARKAVRELGLLDGSRPGWKRINETKSVPGESHGCLFAQKC